jgi:hypothetical protein
MFDIQSVDTTQSNANTYEFNVQASNYEGLVWDFGDGNTDDNPISTHSFTNTQNTVILSVYTNDSCLIKTYSIDVNINTNNMTQEPIDQTEIQIFPNPVNQVLNLKVLKKSNLRVYNAVGKLIIDQTILGQESLNFDHYPNGYYFIQISNDQGTTSHKMIKQ